MTPLKLFLLQAVATSFCFFMAWVLSPTKAAEKSAGVIRIVGWLGTIGSLIVLSVFGTAVWAIFYYL